MSRTVPFFAVVLVICLSPTTLFALIIGGEGNQPIPDRGWPKGAMAVLNNHNRVAWWEGGGFGDPSAHAEGRGDAAALSFILDDFSKIDAPGKQIVVRDGVGKSVWLNQNRLPVNREAAKIDWAFSVSRVAPKGPEDDFPAPAHHRFTPQTFAPRLDIYSANIDWDIVIVPEGIEIIDQRLSTHGYSEEDGNVLEGSVRDLTTGQPMAAVVRVLADEEQQKGPTLPRVVAGTKTDHDGKWILKQVPAGRIRVVVEAEGFAPRLAGTDGLEDQPIWKSYPTGLVKSSPMSGTVNDSQGAPLQGVDVTLTEMRLESGEAYSLPFKPWFKTDKEGRFEASELPLCNTVISFEKRDYPLVRQLIKADAARQELTFRIPGASSINVKIDFPDRTRSDFYRVGLTSSGRPGGEMRTSEILNDDGQCSFENLTPGSYTVVGLGVRNRMYRWPTAPMTFQLEEGESRELTLAVK